MENLGLKLIIGAAIANTVGAAFASVKKQANSTVKDTEKLQLGRKWALDLQSLTTQLKDNKKQMEELGRTAELVSIRKELLDRLGEAKVKAAEFGVNMANAGKKAEEFNKVIKETAFQNIGSVFSNMKSGITEGLGGLAKAGAMGVGLVATVNSFGNVAAGFEKGMAKVSTLVDTTETDMDQLSKNAREMAKSFGFSTDQVSEGMYQALSAGVEVKDLGGFMETAGKMAVGGSIDMATAINGMTSAVNAYKNMNLSAEEASDIMFQTAKRGKTDVGQLAASLSNVTPIASSIGVKFGDVSAAIATLTYSGTPTATATTEIAAALTELSKDGTDVSKTFKRLTGQSFKDYIASGHNLGEAFNVISQGAKMQGKELVDLFVNVTGAKAVMTLTGAAAERFGEDLTEMGSSAGAAGEAFGKMNETTAQRMAKMQAGLNDVKLTIGEAFVPAMLSIGQAVSKIITPIGEFISQHPTLIENMTWATAAAIGLYGALKLGLIIGSLINAYKSYQQVAKGATVIQWAWNVAMTANPIGLVIAGVAALAGLAYVVYKNWEPIVNWFKGVFGWLGDAIGSFFGKTDKIKAEVKKDETKTVKVEKEKEKELPKIGDAFKAKQSETVTEKSDFSSFKAAPAQNKTINVTISNFTVNAQNIEEALPKIVDRVREAIKQGIKDDMENSYAF